MLLAAPMVAGARALQAGRDERARVAAPIVRNAMVMSPATSNRCKALGLGQTSTKTAGAQQLGNLPMYAVFWGLRICCALSTETQHQITLFSSAARTVSQHEAGSKPVLPLWLLRRVSAARIAEQGWNPAVGCCVYVAIPVHTSSAAAAVAPPPGASSCSRSGMMMPSPGRTSWACDPL